jgi:hypothetical protein
MKLSEQARQHGNNNPESKRILYACADELDRLEKLVGLYRKLQSCRTEFQAQNTLAEIKRLEV